MPTTMRISRLAAAALFLALTACVRAAGAAPVGVLEVPPPDSNQSGIGVITGWVCDATRVVLRIDEHEVEAAYGTGRGDTEAVCGDTDNGFGYLINWNALGDGPHRVEALADGVAIGAADVTVSTLGEPFRRGLSGTYELADFPHAGSSTTVEWIESAQGFRIVDVDPAGAGTAAAAAQAQSLGVLENPQSGPVSGIGLVSGWVCDADQILIDVDGALQMQAGYGTSRGDTLGVCGDVDNGFGALINWNLLGDGSHVVRVEADGELVGEATVVVRTLGAAFVRGLQGSFAIGPFGGRDVRLEWQEAQQNFVIDTLTSLPTPTPRPTLRPTPRPTAKPTPTFTPTARPTPRPTPRPTQRACCKICTTGKACGDSCIARSNTCHKGGGCACNG